MNDQPKENSTVRILVVDDSLLIRTLVQETLLKAGFSVFTARDGLEAWALLQKESVHLIVVDMTMPPPDGLELTRMIRADQRLSLLPIILMSAIETKEDQRRGLICGANAFILKERHDLELLAVRIAQLLEVGTTLS